MKRVLNSLLLTVLLSLPLYSLAGFKWIEIGIDGMTCSMCTRSVEMSVRQLDFVDSVVMSLEETKGRIYLKSGSPTDLKKIAKAVVDAGFSVRFVQIEFNFDDVAVSADGSFTYQGQPFVWMEYKSGSVKGEVALKIVDDGFLPRKESALWKKKITPSGGGQKVYHVIQV
jgi:copper chaperone CopZ